MDRQTLTRQIRQKCEEAGFLMCGFSKAELLEKEAKDLEEWLKQGLHGSMSYMENHFDKRIDPRNLVEGAKTVISVLSNYFPPADIGQAEGAPKISTYAWGEDYHTVLKRKLYGILQWINEEVGEVNARVFTDSAPVMDKAWAKRSGLGWIGKHTNLIHPKTGSWFFIGEIIIDVELEYDGPIKDYCGTCTRCIDACPTEALSPYQIDSKKCISYLTIELKEEIPDEFSGKMEGWAYGCDICQQVCPWNRFAQAYSGDDFRPLDHIINFTEQDWQQLSNSQFNKLTRPSAMSRIKRSKWDDNLRKAKE